MRLPFNGESAPVGSQLCLSDKQVSLLTKIHSACVESSIDGPTFSFRKPWKKEEHSMICRRDKILSINEKMFEFYRNPSSNVAMLKFRQTLPCYQKKEEILKCVKDHQVVVISGETGCGKTTQVPQYILEEAALQRRAGHVRLVVTQPRRVAAISVAERVAMETGTRTGDIVGYQVRSFFTLSTKNVMLHKMYNQVRLDSKPPRTAGGSILYCTTGVLVSRLQSDSELQAFTHIIIDEIHERDVLADILLVIIKQIMHKRPDLKIILMSATLNASKFSTFMYDCPTLHVPGFMFPVEQFYLEDALEMTEYRPVSYDVDSNNNENPIAITEEEIAILASEKNLSEETCSNLLHPLSENLNFHLDLVADLIKHLDTKKPPGAILVFVPGWEEITVLGNMLLGKDTILVLPLHGSMSAQDQRKIFQPAQKGLRKVVIATNIAESSVTINDIVYVVDCGKAKKKSFDVESNSSELKVDWISKANAKQRMGRAGRIRKGQVYKMYTKSRELKFGDFMVPEIVRCRLENVILKLKILGCKNIDDFFSQLMDIPKAASVALAKRTLYDIGALKEDGELTGLGWTLGQLPSDPQLGKMMILGAGFGCLDPILSVVTSLDHKSPFVGTSKSRELAEAVDRLSGETASDHLAQANVMAAWNGLNSRGGQAKTYGIQLNTAFET